MGVLSAGVAGFALSMGLILASGPQNIFVLRQGLLRSHVFAVCLVCAEPWEVQANASGPFRIRRIDQLERRYDFVRLAWAI